VRKHKNLRTYSPEFQEIIGCMPHWLVRWGMTSVFVVIAVVCVLSCFITYPDRVVVPVTIRQLHAGNNTEKNQPGPIFFTARGIVSEEHFISIKEGQTAGIRLSAYPYLEYGVLQGRITHKSSVSKDRTFEITIDLGNRLGTSMNKELDFYVNMSGQADILLNKTRLIKKIFRLRFSM